MGIIYCGLVGFSLSTKAANIVIIGDSLSAQEKHGLGSLVFEDMNKGNNRVSLVASCGSSPWWYQADKRTVSTPCGYLEKHTGRETLSAIKHETKKLSAVAKTDLDLAIIQQGTNLYGFLVGPDKKPASVAKQSISSSVFNFIKELKTRSPASSCLWVAPPEITKYGAAAVSGTTKNQMYEAIKDGIQKAETELGYKCSLHDSREDTSAPGGDGTHFSSVKQVQKWVRSVSSKADNILASRRLDEAKASKQH